MTISTLRITNFRNLVEAELLPCPNGLNILSGANGSGKTSILESIYYLAQGKSFRSSTPARLIQHATREFSIYSQIVSENERHIPLGASRDLSGTTRLRLAESDAVSVSELASYLPLRLINSQSHNLFESGPVFRRKFMDWGLFYQFERFLPCWRQYERVLKQRNALLRDRRPKTELNPWTEELVRLGFELNSLRKAYVQELLPIISEIVQELQDIGELEFCYESGFEPGETSADYASLLADAFADEMRMGYTMYGPHRADLDIKINGIPVKHFLSRGQQKLLICAMILAQGRLLNRHTNKSLIYLVDDLPAELDLPGRQKLISLLSKQRTQIFITAIEHEAIKDLMIHLPQVPIRVFHVKHGEVHLDPGSDPEPGSR